MIGALLRGVLAGSILSATSLLYATLGEMVVERVGHREPGPGRHSPHRGVGRVRSRLGDGQRLSRRPCRGGGGGLAMLLFGYLVVGRRANQLASGLAMMFFGIGVSALVGQRFVGGVIAGLPKFRVPWLSDLPWVKASTLFNWDILVYLRRPGRVLSLVGAFSHAVGPGGARGGRKPGRGVCRGAHARAGAVPGAFRRRPAGRSGRRAPIRFSHNDLGEGMTSGRGFIAIALVIFSKWHPLRAIAGALVFGGAEALQLQLQATRRPGLAIPPGHASVRADAGGSHCLGRRTPKRGTRRFGKNLLRNGVSVLSSPKANDRAALPHRVFLQGGVPMKTLKCIAISLLLSSCLAAAPVFAQDKPTLIIGAIYVGSVNDFGYNRSMHDGLEEMKKNIPGVKLIEAENVPESAEAERVMENMIQQGAKLIFPTSFGHHGLRPECRKAAPGRVLLPSRAADKVAPNFGNFFGNTQTAWYPMGVAAGKMTKSNKLGFVVGMPIGYALGNVNAFEMGARSVNPKAQTIVVVTGSWSDKAKEAAAANALLDQGCDVVTMHVDSPATDHPDRRGARWRCPSGSSPSRRAPLAPRGWITGLGFTWAPVLHGDRQERHRPAPSSPASCAWASPNGMMAVAPFGPSVPAETQKLVNDSVASLARGFNPVHRTHQGQQGRRADQPRASPGAGTRWADFNWYVEGVVGKVK